MKISINNDEINLVISSVGIQGATGATGSGAGSSTLTGLTDTTLSSPSDDQVLAYDSTTSKWVNQDQAAGGVDWTVDQGSTNIHSGNYIDTNTTYNVGDGGLTTNDFTNDDHDKLDGIDENANNYSLPVASATVSGGIKVGTNLSIADGVLSASSSGGGGNLTTKGDLEVYGTAQTRLPIGTNDYVLTADSTATHGLAWKVATGAGGGEANVQSDWNQTTDTEDDYIKNKPTLLSLGTTSTTALAGDTSVGDVNVQSDWTQSTTTADDYIKNKPNDSAITDVGGTPTLKTGITQAEVRTAIGAGTSNLVVGTGSGDALAGDTAVGDANVQSDWDATAGDALINNKPTLGTSSSLNVPTTGDASTTEVVKGSDSRLSDARTPTAHSHDVEGTSLKSTGETGATKFLREDGDGTCSWQTVSSSGGATALDGLTDVTIASVENNDLLMYNSTASQWQNTNLGVSVTPTLTGDSTANADLAYTFTVSNHATYDDPAYFVEVYTGSTLVVANSAVTDNGDGTLTFTAPATGTHQIRIRCQDFGDLQSEIATKALTTTELSFTGRYFRVKDFGGTIMVGNFAIYSSASQGGTKYPTNMTSNTAPTPFVASGVGSYSSTYDNWKAFDSNVTGSMYWNLASGTSSTDYVAIDLGSSTTVKSFSFSSGSQAASLTTFSLYYADSSDFSDEVKITDLEFTAINSTITYG